MQQHYQIINAFFDCYCLSNARSIMSRMIKTSDSEKIWTGRSPSDLLFFTEKIEGLMEAVFSIVGRYHYNHEAILEKDENDPLWSLTEYELYCGGHANSTPWDFFPRHLSRKEFLDPYRALEKFTKYHSLGKWKDVFKDLLFHALSPHSLNEFDDGTGILRTYIHLHKLIEASHLIAIRSETEIRQPRYLKWKNRKEPEKQSGEQATDQ